MGVLTCRVTDLRGTSCVQQASRRKSLEAIKDESALNTPVPGLFVLDLFGHTQQGAKRKRPMCQCSSLVACCTQEDSMRITRTRQLPRITAAPVGSVSAQKKSRLRYCFAPN